MIEFHPDLQLGDAQSMVVGARSQTKYAKNVASITAQNADNSSIHYKSAQSTFAPQPHRASRIATKYHAHNATLLIIYLQKTY